MRRQLLILLIFFAAYSSSAQPESVRKKISPALAAFKLYGDKKLQQVFWITAINIESTKKYIQQKNLPVKILAEYPNTGLLVVQMHGDQLDSLLLPAHLVQFADIPRKPKEELALGAWDHGVNSIDAAHHHFPLIHGNGLVISIKENQFDSTDIDFKGRYLSTPFGSGELSSHATIMATTVAGAGNSFYTGKGAAWQSTLSTSSFATLLPDADNDYQRFNISVQNHSYGTGIENYYGADAAAYDATVISRPELLHVFSAGNSGNETSSTGTYSGIGQWANLTGSFKMAKNIITVGAVDSFAAVAALSSKGPAFDGRIKPELVAFGQDGSSGAAATTAGVALLMQQAYKETNGGALPAAALIKAALINTADDVGTVGPDYSSGYGNVNAFKAVNTILQKHYFSGSSTNGAAQQFDITIPAGLRKLSVTVCWSDPPATVNASRALINDLDLVVQNYQPWVLSSFPHIDSLLLPARRTRDSLNNVEQVTIDNPPAGNYKIIVDGYAVPSGPQPFFIAYRSDTANQFSWNIFNQLTANEKNILRWSSTFDNTGNIEYSVDKGTTWSLIGNNLDLHNHFIAWQAPDTFCTVLFRMTIGSEAFVSDTSTLSHPLNMRVGFNCPDSILLYWNAVKNVNQYQVWVLGNRYMQPLLTVSDTLIVIQRSGNPSLHYAVSPVLSSSQQGIRSHTIDYTLQGVACYIKNFLADLADRSVQLNLETGTLYKVKEILFEKQEGNNWKVLHTVPANGSLAFNYADNDLHQGGNTYRAAIVLQNGQIIYSQPATVFNFGASPYAIFPNPAAPNILLQVYSPDLQPRLFILYNSRGQKVLEKQLTNLVSQVSLAALPKGVYFILVVKEGVKDLSASLIIQ